MTPERLRGYSSVMARTVAVPVVAVALMLASCSDAAGPANALALNRAKWEEHGPADYEYMFRRACFCPVDAVGPVQIHVAAGGVVSVIDTLGQPVDPRDIARYFTITVDSLFGVVEHAIDVRADELDVRYHPDLGYPESIVVDYDAGTIDEELALTAGLLLPFSPHRRHPAPR